jgi:hypothetical protein
MTDHMQFDKKQINVSRHRIGINWPAPSGHEVPPSYSYLEPK